ncbi:MAG: AtpZ/AtpI family protein [Candidatus Omnitrophica bacterium]|nr:AtpZ/AtpI family protein [Candidatus Omnitrophota bacterium]
MKEDNPNDWLFYLGLVTQLGLVVVVCILTGFFVGLYIDKKCSSSPIATSIFTIVGIGAGLINAYQLIMRKIK